MRWQADTGEPDSLIGGYFAGPAWNGQAYVDGNGVAATAQYLDSALVGAGRDGRAVAGAAEDRPRHLAARGRGGGHQPGLAARPVPGAAVRPADDSRGTRAGLAAGRASYRTGQDCAGPAYAGTLWSPSDHQAGASRPASGGHLGTAHHHRTRPDRRSRAAVAGRRLWWLYRLARSRPAGPGADRRRCASTRAADAETQVTEVFGQRKLLKWSVPGVAHFLTFWGFIILMLTIIEAYGALFSKTFAIPGIGHWAWVGFLEDLFAVGVLVGMAIFTVIRLRNDPKRGRPQVALLRVAHRRGLARPVPDLPGDRDAADLPRRADQHRRLPVRRRRVRLADRRALAGAARAEREPGDRDHVHPAAARGDPRLRGLRHLLQAPAHRDRAAERAVLPAARTGCARCSRCARTARCSTSRRPTRTPTSSAAARSRTSPGRACSTWPPAPSAAAASRSARPGRPASRCRRRCSSWTCATTRSPRRRTCWPGRTRRGTSCRTR